MKKFLLILLTVALAVCSIVFVGAACSDNTESGNDRIYAIYKIYAAHAESNGSTPLTYEEWLTTIKGENGKDGKDGADGQTPFIGTNGNWWIGSTDTGISAKGKDGTDGKDGATGANGKSAYELYKEIYGYTGTEEEWLYDLVNGNLSIKETHTVTFDSDGGTPVENQQVAEGKKANEPDVPVKTGYTFAGWFVKTTEWNFLAYTVTENVTLKAKWIANTYKITFDTAGGKTLSDMEVTYNEAYTLPTPEKENYVFLGWQENETDFSQSGIWNRTSNAKLTAKWEDVTKIFSFTEKNEEITITKYIGNLSNVIVPGAVNGKPVTAIGKAAFGNNTTIISVTIPDSVTSIGEKAFSGCDKLIINKNGIHYVDNWVVEADKDIVTANIKAGSKGIGDKAFYRCSSLISVTIPNGVTNIGNSVFYLCSGLISVTISDSVTSIGYMAFYGCSSLTNITIPDSVTSIGSSALSKCSLLERIEVDENNKNYASVDGILYNKAKTEFVTVPKNIKGTITIPDGITSIKSSIFKDCKNLKNVTLPNTITNIGGSAFSGCNGLTSITIPDSVTSIGDNAFSACHKLVEVINNSSLNITKGSKENGHIAYYALTVMQSGTSEIVNKDNYLFYTYDNVNYLLDYVGESNDLVLPDDYNGKNYAIYDHAFYTNYSSLTSVTIPNSVTSIGEWAFSYCSSLTSVNIGNGVTSIGSYAFYLCSNLINITMGCKVTTIGDYAFGRCSSLTSINIPDSVTSIGRYAFHKCDKIIKDKNGIYFVDNWIVGADTNTTTADIPAGTKGFVDGAFYDCKNLTSITIPNNITTIGDYAFGRCSSLTSVTLPNSVTSIENYAFSRCSSLTNITIPDSITSIGIGAFSGCNSLTSVTIPNTVTSIGSEAFSGCTGLTDITIPNSVTSIGSEAFSGCTGLTDITIPNSVTSIGEKIFYDCSLLERIEVDENNKNYASVGGIVYNKTKTEIVIVPKGIKGTVSIPDGVTTISNGAFRGCSSLTNITIPDSVTSIGNNAFSSCSSLTSITIPDSIISIGNSAFSGCTGLTSITIPNSVTSIGDSAFLGCFKLVEVINNSSLNITKGSEENGYIAYWALTVKNGGTSEIVNKNDYLFYTYDNVNYLLGYVGESNDLALPEDYNEESYVIYDYAFYRCFGLTSVTIPGSIKSIGNYVFYGCIGLTDITIPNNVTSIGISTFCGCRSLTNITIPDSVTSIGNSAFSSCTGLTNVTIPNSVTSIGDSAFYYCKNLTSVTIGKGVTTIGESVFSNCNNLKTINYTGTKEQWDSINKGESWDSYTGNYTINYNYKEENA